MSNRIKKIIILSISFAIGILIYFGIISIPCLFKTVTKIPCPGCGMTRALKKILNFEIIESLSYNILAIPLFLFFAFSVIILIYDIIKDEEKFETKAIRFLEKHYIIIIILLVISLIVNILRHI